MEFTTYSNCTNCPLHKTCKSIGMPTRALYPDRGPTHEKALLVVGEAPGYQEDLQGITWQGFSGKLLTRFIEACSFNDYIDTYLSNACRCKPDYNSNITDGQVTKCRPNLQADLNQLTKHYKEVVILCCGAKATKSVSLLPSMSKAFTYQGRDLEFFNQLRTKGASGLTVSEGYPPVRVFFTYHPAILAPGRKPALVTAVQDHFSLLRRYLGGTFIPPTNDLNIEMAPKYDNEFNSYVPSELSLDIETYGILKGKNQTVFIPTQSLHLDKIPYSEQVVSVALSYVLPDKSIRSIYFNWEKDRMNLRNWLRHAIDKKIPLLGQNIKFDIQYLKRCDSYLDNLLTPQRCILDDTMLWSYLLFEQRPERGLKELAKLFGLVDYSKAQVTGSSGTATNASDPDLIYYNALDTVATLKLKQFSIEEITRKYGKNTPKLGELCSLMRNWVIWDVIDLETSGFSYSLPVITHTNNLLVCEKKQIEALLKEKENLIISGTGSTTSIRTFLTAQFQSLGMLNSPQVIYTAKTKELSISNANMEVLFEHTPQDHPNRATINLLQRHSRLVKLIGTYTKHACTQSKKGYVIKLPSETVISYPTWYPWPSYDSKKETGISGGTIQARFSCKNPPLQTYPSMIKSHLSSRYGGNGYIAGWDLSQIELRIGAYLSGDPVMLHEYQTGMDRHAQTGLLFKPDADVNDPEFRKNERQLGKTLNFLVLYLGGAMKFKETAYNNLSINLPIDFCKEVIYRFNVKYSVFRKWQHDLIEKASRDGYITAPTGWSRNFSKGQSAIESYRNEIANFPIQLTAAQIMQSAEFCISRDLRALHTRTCVIAQIHDALYLDIYKSEENLVNNIMEKYLTRPPLLDILDSQLGRTVPMVFEKEIIKPLSLSDATGLASKGRILELNNERA